MRPRLATSLSALAALTLLCGCSSTARPESATTTSPAPDSTTASGKRALDTLIQGAELLRRYSLGTDRLGVWVCHVPVGVRASLYNPVDFRLTIDPAALVVKLNKYVTPYFRSLSNDQYEPQFVLGGEVSITVTQNDGDCVDAALAQSDDSMAGVVVIADAEHAENQHGGWGRTGTPCEPSDPCPARTSGRAAYIGASDFHPDWGEVPAVDLLEHEIGHTLGFPHSGGGDGYTSAIDLMSNSAAPRDQDADRRDAPDTLAVNRLAAGWLPLDDVVVATGAMTVPIVPSRSPSGNRMVVLPVDAYRFLSVELIANTGLDAYLPHSGVVIHLVDQTPNNPTSAAGAEPLLNEYRSQVPVSGKAPFTDLMQSGASWSGMGWSVSVASSATGQWSVNLKRIP